jgi:hypothetical protein
MIVPYKDVSASALRLNLVSGVVDTATLHPISKTGLNLVINGISVKIETGILGASHFMTLTPDGGSDSIAEVVVCTEIEPANQRIFRAPLGCGKPVGPLTQSFSGGKLQYAFAAWMEPWSNSARDIVYKLKNRIERANENAGNLSTGLIFRFPDPRPDATGQQPMTMIYLEAEKDRGIRLQTIHSYPNDGKVVITNSKLEKGGCE